MTGTFWKWLSRANARTALLAAAIALLVTGGYWVWRELDSAATSGGAMPSLTAEAPAVTNRVQLLAFIRSQQENRETPPNNIFYKKPQWRPDPGQGNPGTADPFVKPTNPTVKPADNPRPKPTPPPPPAPKEIAVVYRGMMRRPDGSAVALIENQDEQKQKFFTAGDEFLAATVEGFDNETVRLKRPDGAILTLARGQVSKVREK